MFTYTQLHEACSRIKLNPDITGKNPEAKSHLCSTAEKCFNLRSIKFPEKETKEVVQIGNLINNLISQKNFPSHYNLGTKEGKEEYRRDQAIDKMILIAQDSLEYWLMVGLRNSSKPKTKLIIHNGMVYKEDPAFHKAMIEMDKGRMEHRRDFRRKQAHSIESARRIILD